MGAWLESYQNLSVEQQDRVQRWLHLNKFIARSLRVEWDRWVDDYLKRAFEHPLDYSFMDACLPGFSGLEAEGAGVTFSRDVDPATAQVVRVPVRAKNALGRLSPGLQHAVAALLEGTAAEPVRVGPQDVAALQKCLPKERSLAKLKRKDFRSVDLSRDGDEMVLAVEGGAELVRMSVLEFGTEMRRARV